MRLDDASAQIGGLKLTGDNGPSVPPLLTSTIHVWTIPLCIAENLFSTLRRVLSDDELERAARFHFEEDARRFIVARGSVRSILGAYTQSKAEDLLFFYSAQGKPTLHRPVSDIRFNVSHSRDLALLAIARGRDLGVDVEWKKEDIEVEKLVERFFSIQESRSLLSQAPEKKIAAFFRGWTCKEAFLKAQGMGLSRSLNSFDVDMNVGQPARLLATRPDATEADRWFLRELEVAEQYAAAVAVAGPIGELHTLRYGQT
jgi:4'-phosphopantetheinyl transferase